MKKSCLRGASYACLLGGVFALFSTPALASTTYDIITLGPTDAEHTRSTDNYRFSYVQFLNEAGQAAGYAERYNGSTYTGHSAWLYNGTSTVTIGLTDAGHTESSTGYQYNSAQFLNEAGQVAGHASRFNGSTVTGTSAWLYNGTSTMNIGLTDAGHTRSTDGYQDNYAQFLNEAGQVAGQAKRYNGSTAAGQSAWLYNGTSTITIGLTDAVHTDSSTGYQNNDAQFLNKAGQVAGQATRFNGSTDTGRSAWLYNGTSTVNIGLTDAGHTNSSTGEQQNQANFLNEAGQAAGQAERYNGSTYTGHSAWLYNGTSTVTIGLTDAGHTESSMGYQYNQVEFLNEAGQAAGSASRYNGSTPTGSSAWLYNGTNTFTIGLTDAGHTRSTDGYQDNYARFLNEAGQAAGQAQRYNGSTATGQSAWLYNGTSTVTIGLADAEHTRSTDGYQYNEANFLNETGEAAGQATRFNGSTDAGKSAWLYNGTSTVTIGLTDAGHTDSSTGYQRNYANFLNEAGQAAGYAERYIGSTNAGQSAWLYNGTSTVTIGLTDAGHTRTDGYQNNSAQFLNEAGQAAGQAQRFNGSTVTGYSAWFYDATIDQTYAMDLAFSVRPSDGYANSVFQYLGDDGLGLGYYTLFDDGSTNLGDHAFVFTVADGYLDLGTLVIGGLNASGWDYLANAIRANGAGSIIGGGLLEDMTNGEVAYLLTPQAVPVPAAVWLFGSGLLGLIGIARYEKVV